MQITTKNAFNLSLNFKYITKNEAERIFSAKLVETIDINGWNRFTFQLVTKAVEVNADIRSIIDISTSSLQYLLGEIKIVAKEIKNTAKPKIIL